MNITMAASLLRLGKLHRKIGQWEQAANVFLAALVAAQQCHSPRRQEVIEHAYLAALEMADIIRTKDFKKGIVLGNQIVDARW